MKINHNWCVMFMICHGYTIQKNIKKIWCWFVCKWLGTHQKNYTVGEHNVFFCQGVAEDLPYIMALVSRKAAVSRCLTNQLFRGALILDKPSHEKSSSPFSWCFRVSLKIGHPRFTNTSTTRGCQGSPTAASPWTTSRSCKVTGHGAWHSWNRFSMILLGMYVHYNNYQGYLSHIFDILISFNTHIHILYIYIYIYNIR